jgi:protein gp37
MLALHRRFRCLPEYTTYYPEKLETLARTRFPEWSPKRGEPHRPMVFVCDGGDLFHESVPLSFLVEAFDMMEGRPDVTWQVLTKRPERMRSFLHYYYSLDLDDTPVQPVPNIHLGVTVEDQHAADERIPLLVETPAAVRFVSVEPMLGTVRIGDGYSSWLTCTNTQEYPDDDEDLDDDYRDCCEAFAMGWGHFRGIDWVICGAESGPNRRPFRVEWALDLYEQCREAGVAFFGKQDSALHPGEPLVLPGYGTVQEWPHVV